MYVRFHQMECDVMYRYGLLRIVVYCYVAVRICYALLGSAKLCVTFMVYLAARIRTCAATSQPRAETDYKADA